MAFPPNHPRLRAAVSKVFAEEPLTGGNVPGFGIDQNTAKRQGPRVRLGCSEKTWNIPSASPEAHLSEEKLCEALGVRQAAADVARSLIDDARSGKGPIYMTWDLGQALRELSGPPHALLLPPFVVPPTCQRRAPCPCFETNGLNQNEAVIVTGSTASYWFNPDIRVFPGPTAVLHMPLDVWRLGGSTPPTVAWFIVERGLDDPGGWMLTGAS